MWNIKRYLYVVVFCLCFTGKVQSEIKTIHSIQEILPYVSKDSLVVFDIDNTLIRPVQMLGCDEWFNEYMRKLLSQGFSREEALSQTVLVWNGIMAVTKIVLIENGTEQVIADMQKQNIPVMAVSLRGPELMGVSERQLSAVNIVFDKGIFAMKGAFRPREQALYKSGILLCNGRNKTSNLLALLEHMKISLKKILFVDDRKHHVEDMQSIQERGFEYLGFHYVHPNQSGNVFISDTAQKQYERYISIFSDEQVCE